MLVASSTLNTNDTVTLTSGGAIEGAATTRPSPPRSPTPSPPAPATHLTTSGNIGLGTYTTVDAQTNSEVNTYGLAAVGIGQCHHRRDLDPDGHRGREHHHDRLRQCQSHPRQRAHGLDSTIMTGLSNAESYFIGLFAIPLATAVTVWSRTRRSPSTAAT